MGHIDHDLCQRLNPLLDTALDRDATGRADLLASVRADSPELAATLSDLLSEFDQVVAGGFLETPPDLDAPRFSASGQAVGAYTLERPLGSGGMGSVWLGRRSDGRFDGYVAIKLLNLALLDHVGQQRF